MRFLNIKDGQFCFFDKVFGPSIEVPLTLASKRILQWGPSGLRGEGACLDEGQIPPGWTLAYDLDLRIDHMDYRLTIHDGAIVHAFQPYLAQLQAEDRRLEDVITKIAVQMNPKGYSALRFEAVGSSVFN